MESTFDERYKQRLAKAESVVSWLVQQVDAEEGLLAVPMSTLLGTTLRSRLSEGIADEIGNKLRSVGLGHFPAPLPTHGTQWVYLFPLGSPAATLIGGVLASTEGGRKYLDSRLKAMNAPGKTARLKIMIGGSAKALLAGIQRISYP